MAVCAIVPVAEIVPVFLSIVHISALKREPALRYKSRENTATVQQSGGNH